jgi:hypothetical protein
MRAKLGISLIAAAAGVVCLAPMAEADEITPDDGTTGPGGATTVATTTLGVGDTTTFTQLAVIVPPAGDDLSTTFGTLAAVGDSGTGFEGTLDGAYRGLDAVSVGVKLESDASPWESIDSIVQDVENELADPLDSLTASVSVGDGRNGIVRLCITCR